MYGCDVSGSSWLAPVTQWQYLMQRPAGVQPSSQPAWPRLSQCQQLNVAVRNLVLILFWVLDYGVIHSGVIRDGVIISMLR